MITLSFQNVEKLIFYDKKVQRILPEFSDIFAKWTQNAKLGLNSKNILLDFVNSIIPEQVERLRSYWGSPVSVQKLESGLVKNNIVTIDKLHDYLEETSDFGNLSIARDGELIYICNWR